MVDNEVDITISFTQHTRYPIQMRMHVVPHSGCLLPGGKVANTKNIILLMK